MKKLITPRMERCIGCRQWVMVAWPGSWENYPAPGPAPALVDSYGYRLRPWSGEDPEAV